MRPRLGLILAIAAAFAAISAHAQPPARPLTPVQRALLNDIFVAKPLKSKHGELLVTPAAVPYVRDENRTAMGAGGVFALPAVTGSNLDQTRLLGRDQLVNGQGMVVWRDSEVSQPAPGGAIDTLRMSWGGVARAPGGVVSARPEGLLAPDAEAFDVSYTRGWPGFWTASDGRYQVDVSPHAGVGFNNAGGTAEAGAMLRLGRDLGRQVMNKLGGHEVDDSAFAGQGRWFLFAAASGRAVGLNMVPAGLGLPQRAGWSNESTPALVNDAQAGLAWRKGDVQASVGYVHRDVKSQAAITSGPGPASYHDSMVAVSFSLTSR